MENKKKQNKTIKPIERCVNVLMSLHKNNTFQLIILL